MINWAGFCFWVTLNQLVRARWWARAAALLVLSTTSSAVLGEGWFFQPAVSVGIGYEENADLVAEDTSDTTSVAAGNGGDVEEIDFDQLRTVLNLALDILEQTRDIPDFWDPLLNKALDVLEQQQLEQQESQSADVPEENGGLDEGEIIDTMRYYVRAALRGGWLTERFQIIGNFVASREQYPGHEQLNSDNLLAALNTAFLLTERSRLSLDLSYERDTTRTSELTTTGNISGNIPRNQIVIAPAWQYQLTERSRVGLGYSYTQVRFDSNESAQVGFNGIDSSFVNYEKDDVDAFYSYQLTERLAFRSRLRAAFYDPDDDRSYKGYEASLGMRYEFSETFGGSLDIGWQRIDRDTDLGLATFEGTSSGITYDLFLEKEFERSGLSASLHKGPTPAGNGELLEQESLGLGYTYQYSPQWSVTIPMRVYRNEPLGFGDVEEDDVRRIFFETQPSLNWRLTEDMVLSLSYRYQYEQFEAADTTSADSNAVFLSLSYVWPTEISPAFGIRR